MCERITMSLRRKADGSSSLCIKPKKHLHRDVWVFFLSLKWSISSVVEHSPHKRYVVGSIPAWSMK